jgi:hypothetical protein
MGRTCWMHNGDQIFMNIFVRKHEDLFGHRWEDNVKMVLKGSGWASVDLIHQPPPENKSWTLSVQENAWLLYCDVLLGNRQINTTQQ